MILALDIGNTHIVLGCMEGRRIRYLCRMATNRLTTGAEYAVTISRLLEFGHIAPDAFDGAIISSVVPQVTRSLSEAVKMLTGVEPMVVGPGIRSDLTVRLDDPATLASDLLVAAVGALDVYEPPLILIVEDDPALSQGIRLALGQEGRQFVQAGTIGQAERELAERTFDLLILDLNLPDGNGLDLLSRLRDRSALPVLILTANDLEMDQVTGLELGADDYVTKPFSLAVLRARVNSLLRRSRPAPAALELPPFLFDFDAMVFARDGVPLELSKTEQRLLRLLVEHRGQTLTREQLLDRVWDGGEFVDANALSVAVKRLRDKLTDAPIKTVYGLGYTWEEKR